ncbi:hypothetical protein VP01_286g2 [Puccinia sorghi]|uniref:Uncharacterized protein n=1 Tax=Puccinia sorghi TaxID=27349 RepID=A0A0L6V1U3_9BASI|nr:hypothetical protein VP01_286g2 [Puccinia sorghi]
MPQFDASGGSADAEGQPAPEPQPTNPPVDRVEQLSSEVARLQLVMSSMMALMESSPVFQSSLNSQTTQMAGAAMNPTSQPNLPVQSSSATEHPSHTAPPHLQHQSSLGQTVPEPAYRAPMDAEFDHLSRLEPLKIKDLWFAGDAAHLLSFLRTIRDFLRPRSSLFQTETHFRLSDGVSFRGSCSTGSPRSSAAGTTFHHPIDSAPSERPGCHGCRRHPSDPGQSIPSGLLPPVVSLSQSLLSMPLAHCPWHPHGQLELS